MKNERIRHDSFENGSERRDPCLGLLDFGVTLDDQGVSTDRLSITSVIRQTSRRSGKH